MKSIETGFHVPGGRSMVVVRNKGCDWSKIGSRADTDPPDASDEAFVGFLKYD